MENRIKVLREQQKLSQKQVAEIVGTSQQQVQRIETGVQSIRFDLALRICEALETPLQTVFPETRKAVAIARKNGESLNTVWTDRNFSKEMEKAGVDTDPHTWYFRFRLRGGAEGILPVSGLESKHLWHALHRNDPDHYFVVFNSEETQVVLNLNHLIYGHIVWEEPDLTLIEEDNRDWDALGYGLEDDPLSVYLADSPKPLYFSVEPDKPLEGDPMEDEEQFRQLVRLAEAGLQEETDEVISFLDDEGDTAFLRASDVAMIKIPLTVLYAGHWEEEEETDENKEGMVVSED